MSTHTKLRFADTPEGREMEKILNDAAREVDGWEWWKFGDKRRCPSVKGTLRRAFRCNLAEGHQRRHNYVRARKVIVE